MRPVNLIPQDLRRGEQSQLRTGPLPYFVLGALALALIGVTMVVLAGNKIDDRKAEVRTLAREDRAAQAKAERLAAYIQFKAMSEERIATVVSLADSRFDWQRVMREMALILPDDVWLVSLNAVAGPASGGEAGASGGIAGPSLELAGCATGQDAVAGLVTALKDIDGVTRVGLQSSELPPKGAEGGGGGGGEGGDCQTRDFIAKFAVVVAFDAAPVPVVSGEAETVVTSEEPEGGEEAEGEEAEGG